MWVDTYKMCNIHGPLLTLLLLPELWSPGLGAVEDALRPAGPTVATKAVGLAQAEDEGGAWGPGEVGAGG